MVYYVLFIENLLEVENIRCDSLWFVYVVCYDMFGSFKMILFIIDVEFN